MFASFFMLDEADAAVIFPSSSKGCVNMLQTTRSLDVSPEPLGGISVLYIYLYISKVGLYILLHVMMRLACSEL